MGTETNLDKEAEKNAGQKNVSVSLIKVSKKFNVLSRVSKSALYNVLHFFSRITYKQHEVLKNVSLQIIRGEIVGLIGKNGSGKSTLLRIIAGIYTTDQGKVMTCGETLYLSSTTHALKEVLTMRENIYLVCTLYGLSENQITGVYDEIISFSELENYVNTPLFQFSSGMKTRLGFSIAIFCANIKEYKVLLLDEFFGGTADYSFQKKSLKKMESYISCGATVLMVSHNLDLIIKYCSRAILLDGGEIKQDGEPKHVAEAYKKLVAEEQTNKSTLIP